MSGEQPVFGEASFYKALAEALNEDSKWLEMATEITYSMTHVYLEPVDKSFFINFEGGKITEVTELSSASDRSADFVISGKPETWQAVIQKALSPVAAMTTSKLKVDGKLSVLLKNMSKFSYLIDKMTTLDLVC